MIFAIHWHGSAIDLHVFPVPIPPPASLPTPSLWVFPVNQPWALISCIQPGLVICFTLDNIHVSMLCIEIIFEYILWTRGIPVPSQGQFGFASASSPEWRISAWCLWTWRSVVSSSSGIKLLLCKEKNDLGNRQGFVSTPWQSEITSFSPALQGMSCSPNSDRIQWKP